MSGMGMAGSRDGGSAKLGVVLFVVAALMSFGVGLTLAAPPFVISIDVPISASGLTVSLTGTADSPSQTTHHVEIVWGDGNTDVLPDFASDAPWTWGPVDHTYAAAGTYTITTTLIHATNQGNDQGTATDSSTVTVLGAEEPPAETVTPPAEVLPKVIKKKPLAKTGAETAGLTVIGIMLMMAGATIRFILSGDEDVTLNG